MILVFGSTDIDLVARVPAIARPGETVLSHDNDRRFGGKGAHQAVAASRARRDADPGLRRGRRRVDMKSGHVATGRSHRPLV